MTGDTFKQRKGADMSSAELAQRVQAGLGNIKHGMRTREVNEEFIRLRALLDSHPGRVEARKDLAAIVMLIVLRGQAYLATEEGAKHYSQGGGPLSYLGTYMALLERLLKGWPQAIDEAIDVGWS